MYKFSFVILHYENYYDTIECIESILKNVEYANYDIIVVDNGSRNLSGEILEGRYKNKYNIYVIINKENLGFSKGNNVGFSFAKNKLNSDFIILINNDIVIKQRGFLKKITELYEKNRFYIMGPDIISLKDGKHQNPLILGGISKKNIKKRIIKLKIVLVLNYLRLEYLLRKIQLFFNYKEEDDTWKNFNKKQSGVTLFGAALIFSPIYVEKFSGLFDKTFMYCEEHILFFLSKQNNIELLYDPSIYLYHKEGSSTEYNYKGYKKLNFFYKNSIKSLKILLDLYNGKIKWK